MFLFLMLFVVAVVVVLSCWLIQSRALTWSCEGLSNKAVLITGCDFNEIAREIALLLDNNGVPVFACYSNETNAHELRYDVIVSASHFVALFSFAVFHVCVYYDFQITARA